MTKYHVPYMAYDKRSLMKLLELDNMTDADYHALWDTLGPIEIKMVEKHGECKHALGDTFYYENPYKKPQEVCNALLHVLDLYTWRIALGFPSWEADDRAVHRIHCPDKTGTVWEMRKINHKEGDA